jgi:hypothetical protein
MSETPDLYDVSRCPVGHRCESCGVESDDVAVAAIVTPLGVICLSRCGRCESSDDPAPIHVGTAARLIEQHRAHVTGGARHVSDTRTAAIPVTGTSSAVPKAL